jgi:diphthamide synthase (EF-2-diphthine--ammonia ligase)
VRPKAFVSWSSGKDSAYALHEARLGLAEIAGVLTTVNEVYDRVAMHGVRSALLDRQIDALGLPAIKVPIPSPCPNEIYEARMEEACERIKAQGIRHIVFGDLYLEDIRAYRIEKLSAAGMEPIFPLWKRDTGSLAREMIASGLSPASPASIRANSTAASRAGASIPNCCATCRTTSIPAARTANSTRR